MKKSAFTLLCAILAMQAYAQDYHPFVTGIDSVKWNTGMCFEGCGSFELRVPPVDTVYLDSTWRPLYFNYYPSLGSGQLLGWLHEDTSTRKVHFRRPYEEEPNLLYDFSLSVGDSMIVKRLDAQGNLDSLGWAHVDSIGTYLTLGGERKILYLTHVDPWYNIQLRWVEGIGALEFDAGVPIANFTNCRFDNDTHVFKHDFPSGWWSPDIDTACAFLSFGAVPRLDYDQSAQIFPNPATSNCRVKLKEADNSLIRLMIVNATGQLVHQSPASGQAADISLTGLPAGYYTIVIQTRKGNLVRPLVKQAD